jgi:prolyl-tRNA synthetase
MRLSQVPLKTLREDPVDAESPSHRLLLRSGQLLRLGPGLFAHGPLLPRVIDKLVALAKRELAGIGVHPIDIPALQPKELHKQSGTWARLLAESRLLRLADGKQAELCLVPEADSGLLRFVNFAVDSYKQLPLRCCTLLPRFADSASPRGGLLGARESRALSVLSCDIDAKGMEATHKQLVHAFERILVKCRIRLMELQAAKEDPHKDRARPKAWFAESEGGAEIVLHCDSCGYAAEEDKAEARFADSPQTGAPSELRRESTPGIRSVEELERFFDMPAARMAKTILFDVSFVDREETIAVLMRGDLDIDTKRLARALGAHAVQTAEADVVRRVTGAEVGFAGPIGLKEPIRVFADQRLRGQTRLLTGCCETDYHCLDVELGRDCPEPEYLDVARAEAETTCAICGAGLLRERRGTLLGRSRPLGSGLAAMQDALFVGEDGQRVPFWLSSHFLDLGRMLGAIVEQHHDGNGIRWPAAVAPFEYVVAILDPRKPEQRELGEQLFAELCERGVDVCLDDRQMSPGAKFKDLDLLGFPSRIVIGRDAGQSLVEFSRRGSEGKDLLPLEELRTRVQARL